MGESASIASFNFALYCGNAVAYLISLLPWVGFRTRAFLAAISLALATWHGIRAHRLYAHASSQPSPLIQSRDKET
jgi:hypothetical protein